jgi:hypothetical protein
MVSVSVRRARRARGRVVLMRLRRLLGGMCGMMSVRVRPVSWLRLGRVAVVFVVEVSHHQPPAT